MRIWKLSPIDLKHRDWEASSHTKEVIIRAESEERARKIAANSFRIAATKPHGERLQRDPWQQTALVSSIEITNERYSTAGEAAILDPEEARNM